MMAKRSRAQMSRRVLRPQQRRHGLLLGLHGVIRVKIRKFREGKVVPLPPFLPPLLSLIVLAVIVLAVVKPF